MPPTETSSPWRSGRGGSGRDGASLVRDAITRNEHDSSVVKVTGRLQTVGVVRSADLITDDGLLYKIVVPARTYGLVPLTAAGEETSAIRTVGITAAGESALESAP